MFQRAALALAAGLALLACSPQTGAGKTETGAAGRPETDDPNAEIVPDNPFFGKWQLVRAQVAPWWDHKGEEPQADPAFSFVEFQPKNSSGPPIATCDKPQYSVSIITPPGLFEGNLKEPWSDVRALGFTTATSDITQMTLTCQSGGKDVSLDFPMLADDTILLGLDNVIYTLQRSR